MIQQQVLCCLTAVMSAHCDCAGFDSRCGCCVCACVFVQSVHAALNVATDVDSLLSAAAHLTAYGMCM